jgi:hypothetical protein
VGIQTKTGKRELGHVCAPYNDCTCPFQTLDDHRIRLGGLAVLKDSRAGSRNFACNIKEVFYRNRQTCQKTVFGSARHAFVHLDKRSLAFTRRVSDCVETFASKIAALNISIV